MYVYGIPGSMWAVLDSVWEMRPDLQMISKPSTEKTLFQQWAQAILAMSSEESMVHGARLRTEKAVRLRLRVETLRAARPLPKRHVVAMHGGPTALELEVTHVTTIEAEVVRHQLTRCLANTPVGDTQCHQLAILTLRSQIQGCLAICRCSASGLPMFAVPALVCQ